MNISTMSEEVFNVSSANSTATAPAWMIEFVAFRKRLFLRTVEPVIVALLGPVEEEKDHEFNYDDGDMEFYYSPQFSDAASSGVDETHRRLGFLPNYVEDAQYLRESSMTMASFAILFAIMSCIGLIFLSCFYHNQKTSPLFISPRRNRLPKLVPPPLPIDGYFAWVSYQVAQAFSLSFLFFGRNSS